MMRPRLLAVALAMALMASGCSNESSTSDSAKRTTPTGQFAACPTPTGARPSGTELPDLGLPCLDNSGTEFHLGRPTGKPLVVNLWASWCPPCGKEIPAFVRLAADAHDKLVVLGVITEDNLSKAVKAAAESDVHFSNVEDRAGELRRALGRHGLPVTLFIDAAGHLQHVYNGPALTDETLRSLTQKHLQVTLT